MPRTYSDTELLNWLDRFDVIALLMSLPPRTQFIEFECGGVGEVDGPRVSFREQLIKTIEASPAAATQSGSSGSEGDVPMRELEWIEVEDGKWKADDAPHVWNMIRIRSDEYRFYCDTDFRGFGTCFRDAAQNADAMRLFPSLCNLPQSPSPLPPAEQPPLNDQEREILRTGEWPLSLMVETVRSPELFTLAGQTIFQISGANGAPALQWESYPLDVPVCDGGLTTREYASHPDLCRGFALDRAHAIQRTMEEFEAEQWMLRGRFAPGAQPICSLPIPR